MAVPCTNMEYPRGDVYSNTVKGTFSIFKRGMRSTYQHCSEKHLNRHLAKFDFHYTDRQVEGVNDLTRANAILEHRLQAPAL